jgi:hypothetical protein
MLTADRDKSAAEPVMCEGSPMFGIDPLNHSRIITRLSHSPSVVE